MRGEWWREGENTAGHESTWAGLCPAPKWAVDQAIVSKTENIGGGGEREETGRLSLGKARTKIAAS